MSEAIRTKLPCGCWVVSEFGPVTFSIGKAGDQQSREAQAITVHGEASIRTIQNRCAEHD